MRIHSIRGDTSHRDDPKERRPPRGAVAAYSAEAAAQAGSAKAANPPTDVPHGTARVRTQVSAAHSREDLEFATKAFAEVNEGLK